MTQTAFLVVPRIPNIVFRSTSRVSTTMSTQHQPYHEVRAIVIKKIDERKVTKIVVFQDSSVSQTLSAY